MIKEQVKTLVAENIEATHKADEFSHSHVS
jgi:hypothetical protein